MTSYDQILHLIDKMRLEIAVVGGRVSTLQHQQRRHEQWLEKQLQLQQEHIQEQQWKQLERLLDKQADSVA